MFIVTYPNLGAIDVADIGVNVEVGIVTLTLLVVLVDGCGC
jgi:hypothetical protein